MATVGPNPQQSKIIDTLVGLPFVVASLHPSWSQKVLGELLNGAKVRAEYAEEVFNAALCVDAIDGAGAWRRKVATPEQLEVLAIAEKAYGVTLAQALPVWLSMPKVENLAGAGYQWDNRPRKLWPRATPFLQ